MAPVYLYLLLQIGVLAYLTLSRRQDVSVIFFSSTGADMTLRTLIPLWQIWKARREGVLYYYAGWRERVNKTAFQQMTLAP